jgi:hypothetical protein
MKAKDPSASRIWIEAIGEPAFYACALIKKRKGSYVCGEIFGQALAIFRCLYFHSDKRKSFLLSLYDTSCSSIDI